MGKAKTGKLKAAYGLKHLKKVPLAIQGKNLHSALNDAEYIISIDPGYAWFSFCTIQQIPNEPPKVLQWKVENIKKPSDMKRINEIFEGFEWKVDQSKWSKTCVVIEEQLIKNLKMVFLLPRIVDYFKGKQCSNVFVVPIAIKHNYINEHAKEYLTKDHYADSKSGQIAMANICILPFVDQEMKDNYKNAGKKDDLADCIVQLFAVAGQKPDWLVKPELKELSRQIMADMRCRSQGYLQAKEKENLKKKGLLDPRLDQGGSVTEKHLCIGSNVQHVTENLPTQEPSKDFVFERRPNKRPKLGMTPLFCLGNEEPKQQVNKVNAQVLTHAPLGTKVMHTLPVKPGRDKRSKSTTPLFLLGNNYTLYSPQNE